jgi:hypothetical protein
MREKKNLPNRHPHHALSARTVNSTNRPGRYADGGGLYLLVAPTGSKSWVLRTIVKKKRCDIGLGSVAIVSLAEARESAQRLRKLARAGGDPLAQHRREKKGVPTFEAAALEVHSAHAAAFRNEKHKRQWLASLEPVFKEFGAKSVDSVTSADVLAALNPIWLKRPETSRRVLQRVRIVFDWCNAKGLREGDNPTLGVAKVLPKHRASRNHHAALPYRQLPEFVKALRSCDAGLPVKLAFEFMILTASRTSETLLAQWAEMSVDAAVWTVPGVRMKTGVEHRVPLPARCLEILKLWP